MKSIEELEKIIKETKKKYKGKWSKLNESETLKKYLHLKGINTKLQTLKEVLELIKDLDKCRETECCSESKFEDLKQSITGGERT